MDVRTAIDYFVVLIKAEISIVDLLENKFSFIFCPFVFFVVLVYLFWSIVACWTRVLHFLDSWNFSEKKFLIVKCFCGKLINIWEILFYNHKIKNRLMGNFSIFEIMTIQLERCPFDAGFLILWLDAQLCEGG